MPHRRHEPAPVLRLAFRSDARAIPAYFVSLSAQSGYIPAGRTHAAIWWSRPQLQIGDGASQTPSTGLRHPSFRRKVPESGARRKGASLTQDIAARHLPPNSARLGYATEWGTLYLRAAVQRRCQRPPKGLGTSKTVDAAQRRSMHVNMRRVHPR